MEDTAVLTRESLLADAEVQDASSGFTAQEAAKQDEGVADTSANSPSKPDAEPAKESATSPVEEIKEGELLKDSKPKSKFAANEERKNKTWSELNADKEALKKEREVFQSEQSRLQSERDQFTKAKASPDSEFRDVKGHTVKDYDDAAKRFDAEGDAELAAMARGKSESLKQAESQFRRDRSAGEFNQKWIQNYTTLAEKDPDLKDEKSATYLGMLDLLRRFPVLTKDPDGLTYAYEAVSMSKKGKEFEASKAEVNQLREELNKYQKKLSIGGSVAVGQPQGAKTFDKLSSSEQRDRLMSMAEEFDNTR